MDLLGWITAGLDFTNVLLRGVKQSAHTKMLIINQRPPLNFWVDELKLMAVFIALRSRSLLLESRLAPAPWTVSHSVNTPVSTGYKATRHANMLWHFAWAHVWMPFLSDVGPAGTLQMSPSWDLVPSVSQCGNLPTAGPLALYEKWFQDHSI